MTRVGQKTHKDTQPSKARTLDSKFASAHDAYFLAFLGAGPATGVLARDESTSSSAPVPFKGVEVPVAALRLRGAAASPPSDLRLWRPFGAESPASALATSFSTREINVWQRRAISIAVRYR